jgi:hypothetical protein
VCSSGDKTAKATEQSQAAFSNTLQASFATAFANNQAILQNLKTTLSNIIANPTGFSPAALTAARTNATDNVSREFQSASTAANAVAAAHGGDALPSGVSAQVSGQIAQGAAAEQSKEQEQITLANEQQRQQNYWNAIGALGGVANAENPTGYAGSSSTAANASTNAGNLLLQSQQATWGDIGGIISGVAGLGTSIATGGLSGLIRGRSGGSAPNFEGGPGTYNPVSGGYNP